MKTILTIAGSDSSGGAGIQADIKTITAHKMYAMSAVTALTAQNTTGVYGVLTVSDSFLAAQLDAIFSDIPPDAVKIGMVSNGESIRLMAEKLQEYQAKQIVIDPVMVSTSGFRLLSDEAMDALVHTLLPLGTLITPNLPEMEVLCGFPLQTEADMLRAVQTLSGRLPGAILLKGGHRGDEATDLLYEKGQIRWFRSPRIDTPNTHGTGCTLSSAIACHLADGKTLQESILQAKAYVTGCLQAGLVLGKGSGPIDHTHHL